ncbi:MAG: glycoside hydrolase family 11 protein [Lachnospiraceae bacterium]|nr:glycoside hydrolase family 11 protein [Lachnospiraceae bacterium]
MKFKRVIALLAAMAMVFGLSSTPVFARDYVQSWVSCCGNITANGTHDCSVGRVQMSSNLNTGNFSVTWQTKIQGRGFNNLQGVGWRTGRDNRVMGYNAGSFNHTSGSTGCTYLTAYGWFRSPLTEWYVVDRWANYGNTTGTNHGTVSVDGGTYNVISERMTGANITGNGPFLKIKSVRNAQRPIGQNNTVTFQTHVNRWRQVSNPDFRNLSQHDYQTIIIEGFQSSGNANVTMWGN